MSINNNDFENVKSIIMISRRQKVMKPKHSKSNLNREGEMSINNNNFEDVKSIIRRQKGDET